MLKDFALRNMVIVDLNGRLCVFCGDPIKFDSYLFVACVFAYHVQYNVCRWLGLGLVRWGIETMTMSMLLNRDME